MHGREVLEANHAGYMEALNDIERMCDLLINTQKQTLAGLDAEEPEPLNVPDEFLGLSGGHRGKKEE